MTHEQYLQQFQEFLKLSKSDGRFTRIEASHEILTDDRKEHNELDFSPDYGLHTGWAARKIAALMPKSHITVSSYVYLPILVSAFVPVTFIDIRSLPITLPNLSFIRADATALPFADNSVESIDCLHSCEHYGLGRYSDTLDAQGDLKAARELSRILAPGGQLLIVLPMREIPCVRFNGERLLSFQQVVNEKMFPGLTLTEFSVIHAGRFIHNAELKSVGMDDYTGCFAWTK